MTPIAGLDEAKMQQEVNKELDKAKDALTNLALLGLADSTGNQQVLNDPVLASKVEALFASHLKTLIPAAVVRIAPL